MIDIWIYALVSVIIVSLLSLVGIIPLALLSKNQEKLKRILIYMISFSAGALFGDVFIHLMPEIIKEQGFSIRISLYLLSGVSFSFIVEKVIHWRHCHLPITSSHVHRFAIMNLFGDAVHNFLDGLVIGASYLLSIPAGIATTLAVIFHEIPQEIGDFGVLIHGGFSRNKALFFNFITALTAVLGTILSLVLFSYIDSLLIFLVPFAAGGFIYIAGSDLIPELHKECGLSQSLLQFLTFALGVCVMLVLLLVG